MRALPRVSRLPFLLGALCLPGLAACQRSGASAAGSGAAISPGAPTFNAQFRTRNPRVCAKVTHVPSAAEAAVMVQCDHESNSRTTGSSPGFFLATNVEVELGSPRAYDRRIDDHWDAIDPSAPVYPVRGSSVGYTCIESNPINQGKNCQKSYGGRLGQGACWHTSFNEWRCAMTIGGPEQALQVPGPTTF